MNKRGNPNWLKLLQPIPDVPTEFEIEVARLGLMQSEYSMELKSWCDLNRNRVYVPEWLLDEWGMEVELNFLAT